VPFVADLKPSGKYVMEDVHKVGGTPAIMKYLLEHGLLDGSLMTVTGKTIFENLKDLPGLKAGQKVRRDASNASSASGSRGAGHALCAAVRCTRTRARAAPPCHAPPRHATRAARVRASAQFWARVVLVFKLGARAASAGDRADGDADQVERPPADPLRQRGARGLGGQDHRQGGLGL
jgi:hypothetical protein